MAETSYLLSPDRWTEIGEDVVTVSTVYDVNNGGYVPVFIATGAAAPESLDAPALQYPAPSKNPTYVFNVGITGEKVYARPGFNRNVEVIVSAAETPIG